MIVVRELTKRYGPTLALDRLSFEVRSGVVTGFLGPNGAGKSTTLRILLGLHHPTSGEALIGNRRYHRIRWPMREVGAVLDANAAHPGRTAFDHVWCLARSNGIGRARVTAVLEQVGLAAVAHKRVGGFSLGMRQRLGIAGALLGDPAVILLDEPVNGLDAAGIRWIRATLRSLAAEGRTVLLSSHLMSEVALTVDHVLIVGRGRLLEETSMADLNDRFGRDVLVRSPRADELAAILTRLGASATPDSDGRLVVVGLDATTVADAAAAASIPVHELTPRSATLEDVYLTLTSDAVEYRAGQGAAGSRYRPPVPVVASRCGRRDGCLCCSRARRRRTQLHPPRRILTHPASPLKPRSQGDRSMSYLGSTVAAANTGTTVAGITFWVVLLAAYLALILLTLRSIMHTPLTTRARTRWVWLVFLAPLIGSILWFLTGRPAIRSGPNTDRA